MISQMGVRFTPPVQILLALEATQRRPHVQMARQADGLAHGLGMVIDLAPCGLTRRCESGKERLSLTRFGALPGQ